VAAGIFTVDLLVFDGSSTQGDARYTLIWANSLILNFKN
jgi:hypothetical protein